MKYLWILFLGIIMAGCHTKKSVVGPAANTTRVVLTPGEPHLLLLTGTISYDSLSATYHIDISNERYVDGYLNLNDSGTDFSGLHYVQLSSDSTVISRHTMENPLLRDIEYLGASGFEHKVTVLPKADLFLRIQLDDGVRCVEFRNGQQVIKRLQTTN